MTGLQALEKLQNLLSEKSGTDIAYTDEYDLLCDIGKELKAFQIVKDKNVDTFFIKKVSLEEYNKKMQVFYTNYSCRLLTQEEYDLIREVLL